MSSQPCDLTCVSLCRDEADIHFYNDMTLDARIFDKQLPILVDTGAQLSVASQNFINSITHPLNKLPPSKNFFKVASGDLIRSEYQVRLPIKVGDKVYRHCFHVIEKLHNTVILGRDFLSKHRASLDFTNNKIHFTQNVTLSPVQACTLQPGKSSLIKVKPKHDFQLPPGLNGVLSEESSGIDKLEGLVQIIPILTRVDDQGCVTAAIRNSSDNHLKVKPNELTLNFEPVSINDSDFTKPNGQIHDALGISAADYFEICADANDVMNNRLQTAQCENKTDTIVYDRHLCAWKNEALTSFDPDDKPTMTKPDQPYVLFDLSSANVSRTERHRLRDMLRTNKSAFVDSSGKLGHYDHMPMEIHLNPDYVPKRIRPFRCPFHLKHELQSILDDLLENSVIEKCKPGNWSTPCFVIRKPMKKGQTKPQYRILLDFRFLNKNSKDFAAPAPLVDNLIDSVARGAARVFSSLDLTQSYHQVSLHENSRDYTAFNGPDNETYCFSRLPQGYKNSGAHFQRVISHILNDCIKDNYAVCYVDDVLCFSGSNQDAFSHLNAVLSRIRKANLKLNPEKCQFITQSVEFLGFVISDSQISISPKHLAAIKNYPRPTCVKATRGFLGLAAFCAKFLHKRSELCAPLYNLTKKGQKFQWLKEHETAFNQIKSALLTSPVLALPNFKHKFHLNSDGSCHGIASVLFQEYNGTRHIVAYYSRSLRDYEKNYSSFYLELLAITESCVHFSSYLLGRPFKILTDHQPLVTILTQQQSKDRKVMRWLNKLQEYNFDVSHVPGKLNVAADSMSRYPDTQNSEPINLDPDLKLLLTDCNLIDLIAYDLPTSGTVRHMGNNKVNKTLTIKGIRFPVPDNIAPLDTLSFFQDHIDSCLAKVDDMSLPSPVTHDQNITNQTSINAVDNANHNIGNFLGIQAPEILSVCHSMDTITNEANSADLTVTEGAIDRLLYTADSTPGICMVTTRKQAREAASDIANRHKDHLKYMSDLPIVNKHLLAPDLFDEPSQPSDGNVESNKENTQDAQDRVGNSNIHRSRNPTRLKHSRDFKLHHIDQIWEETEDFPFTLQELQKCTKEDPVTGDIYNLIEFDKLPKKVRRARFAILREHNCFVHEGCVYQITESSQIEAGHLKIRLFVPRSLAIKTVAFVHKQSGHVGVLRTIELLRRKFIFPQMFSLTRALVISCETCQQNKRSPRLTDYRHLFEMNNKFFWSINLDFIGPMECTARQNQYILSIRDRTTRYCILIALRDLRCSTVLKAFQEKVIAYFGCPIIAHCDNGSPFQSNDFMAFCNHFGIKPIHSSVSLSRSNGLVENLNKQVTSGLRGLCKDQRTKWDTYLPFLQLIINSTVYADTGICPQVTITGQAANLPMDNRIENPADHTAKLHDILQDSIEARELAKTIIARHVTERANTDKLKHDSNLTRKPLEIQPGHIVYYAIKRVIKQEKRTKLQPQNLGPLLVMKVLKNGALSLKCLQTNKVYQRPVHRTLVTLPTYYKGHDNLPILNMPHLSIQDQNLVLAAPAAIQRQLNLTQQLHDNESDDDDEIAGDLESMISQSTNNNHSEMTTDKQKVLHPTSNNTDNNTAKAIQTMSDNNLQSVGHEFVNGKLIDIETSKPFKFHVYDDETKNQERYRIIGNKVTHYVYHLLENDYSMTKAKIPHNAEDHEPQTFVFVSNNIKIDVNKLLIIMHGGGYVKAGQFSQRQIINHGLQEGSQLLHIDKALSLGYSVVILNTNDNRKTISGYTCDIRGSETPERHAQHAWEHIIQKLPHKEIHIIAHSYAGEVVLNMAQHCKDFMRRVSAVALLDSTHKACEAPVNCRNWLIKHAVNYVPQDSTPMIDIDIDIQKVTIQNSTHDSIPFHALCNIFKFFKGKSIT